MYMQEHFKYKFNLMKIIFCPEPSRINFQFKWFSNEMKKMSFIFKRNEVEKKNLTLLQN